MKLNYFFPIGKLKKLFLKLAKSKNDYANEANFLSFVLQILLINAKFC
jgi:hypothetical protein